MAAIDWDIAKHSIPLYIDIKPTKPKPHKTNPKWALKIKEEVQKHLDVGFIKAT